MRVAKPRGRVTIVKVPTVRLDRLLVERELSRSRENARAMILAGDVRVDGQVETRPSIPVSSTIDLTVTQPPPYVSRGGVKLAHALDVFAVDVTDQVLLDTGASTGGFTDVLLQRGARRVYAVDVGHGQLAWKLRQDDRVVTLEKTNIRYLTSLPEPVDGGVVDVSFISLLLVLPPVLRLMKPGGWLVALIKPQFEAGRAQVGKGGVVRDAAIHREVLERVLTWVRGEELAIGGCTPSPIVGPAGNREFLVLLRRESGGISVDEAIARCLKPGNEAHPRE